MTLRHLLLVDDGIGAWVTDEHGTRPAPPGERLGFAALASALRCRLGAGVEIATRERLPGLLTSREDEGTAIILASGMLRDVVAHDAAGGRLGRRVFLAAAARTGLVDTVERHGLAGAADQRMWLRWRGRPEATATIVGRLDVGRVIGADPASDGLAAGHRYGWVHSPACRDLPALIAAYLMVYFS